MSHTRRVPGMVEAACLVGLAGFIVYLVFVGNYWMYLNPKYKEESVAAAVILGGLGVYSFVRPPAGATWRRALVYVFVAILCLVSELGIQTWSASADAQEAEETQPSRVTKGQTEYVRINLGELYDICGKNQQDKLGWNFAVRGFARRSPDLDAKGEFILYRVALYCCFADTTAVGFRVRPPEGKELPEDGSWQVVYGRLEPSKDPSVNSVASLGGSVFASVEPDYRIDASIVESEKIPAMDMMYEWRSNEPYAY